MNNPNKIVGDVEAEHGLDLVRRAVRSGRLGVWFSSRDIHRTIGGFNSALARAVTAWAVEHGQLHSLKLKTGGRPTTKFAFKQQDTDSSPSPALARKAVEGMDPTCAAHPENLHFWRVRVTSLDQWGLWNCADCMRPPQAWPGELEELGVAEGFKRTKTFAENGQPLEHPHKSRSKPPAREYDSRTGAPSFDAAHDACKLHPNAEMLWLNSGHQQHWNCLECLHDGRDMLDRLTARFGAWTVCADDPENITKIEPAQQRPPQSAS